jgi:16S rRNA (adenine1518-N6/adenine1519-N6)-dimethyltransferase
VNARSLGLSRYVVAANIPYYITGEIIRTFLESDPQPRALVLLVQKEVAERIIARDKKESILSISVRAYGSPRIVAKVARGNFSPPPQVDSAILCIDNISRSFFDTVSEGDFFSVVRAGFSSKRKFLANTLGTRFDKRLVRSVFERCGVHEKARAEDIPLATWRALALALTARDSA